MKILALEFSSPQRSVAVADAGRVVSEIIETGGHGASSLALIDEALRESKLEREQIECLAIGLGPGSYTGIRAAIAIAQGWQLARGVKLLGVSSAEAIAVAAESENVRSRMNVVIDAQRGEFYIAGYEMSAGARREIEPLRLAGLNDVQALEKAGGLLIGPEVTRWFAAGKVLFPRAATLAEMAASRNDFVPGEKLEPIYLRETSFVKAPPPKIFQ